MKDNLSKKIGKRLKLLRIEKDLKQSELAEILKVTDSNVSKYERGDIEINFETLVKISKYFDVSLDYLFGFTPARKEADLKIDESYFTVSKKAADKGITPEQIEMAINFYMTVVNDLKSKENKNNK
jgi:transcriptional regulator with XRE-family HTH domain